MNGQLLEYYVSEGFDRVEAAKLFDIPAHLYGTRADMAWLDAAKIGMGYPNLATAGVYPDTVGGGMVVSALRDADWDPLIGPAWGHTSQVVEARRVEPKLPLVVLPPQYEGFWVFDMPQPNFMAKLAQSGWKDIDEEELAALVNWSGSLVCGKRPPGNKSLTIACDYFARDVGIDRDIWFWTAIALTVSGDYSKNPLSVHAMPSTLLMEGARDDYDQIVMRREEWHKNIDSNRMKYANDYVRSNIESAIFEIYRQGGADAER